MNSKDIRIISALRSDARMPLTKMSRLTRIPISTLFDKIKAYNGDILVRHTCLLDFEKLGFHARANVLLKVGSNSREDLQKYLINSINVNSVLKINNNYDYMFEGVFQNVREMEDFLWKLEQRFVVISKEVHYIIEDIKKEAFLSEPGLVETLGG